MTFMVVYHLLVVFSAHNLRIHMWPKLWVSYASLRRCADVRTEAGRKTDGSNFRATVESTYVVSESRRSPLRAARIQSIANNSQLKLSPCPIYT